MYGNFIIKVHKHLIATMDNTRAAAKFPDVRDLTGALFADGKEAIGHTLILNSTDRVGEGAPGRYRIMINPRLYKVFAITLNAFAGSITPFNIRRVTYFIIQVKSLSGGITQNHVITFAPGEYTLQNLLDVINSVQDKLRFIQDTTTRRVIVSRVLNYASGLTTGINTPVIFGDSIDGTTFATDGDISAMLGFPAAPITIPATILYVQSVQPVLLSTSVAKSLVIQLENATSGVVSTNGISGAWVIPLTSTNYNAVTKRVEYRMGNEWEQVVRTNNQNLSELTIRVLDADTGEPFYYVGEHVITATFWQTHTR